MRKLILIKHSQPCIDPGVPWYEWRLSDDGRRRCQPLAAFVARYSPHCLHCSNEIKAVETAEAIGARLGLTPRQVPDLRENDRTNLPILPPDQIRELFKDFFARPRELVVGLETAYAARDRFSGAVGKIVESHKDGDIAVVAHGTVITLFVAAHNQIEPYAFWQKLGLPSAVVLSLPDYGLLDVADEVR